jgi:hypothetical protein
LVENSSELAISFLPRFQILLGESRKAQPPQTNNNDKNQTIRKNEPGDLFDNRRCFVQQNIFLEQVHIDIPHTQNTTQNTVHNIQGVAYLELWTRQEKTTTFSRENQVFKNFLTHSEISSSQVPMFLRFHTKKFSELLLTTQISHQAKKLGANRHS